MGVPDSIYSIFDVNSSVNSRDKKSLVSHSKLLKSHVIYIDFRKFYIVTFVTTNLI